MDIKVITEDTNLFDNLKNRPDKPTSQEISDLIHPIPSGVNDNAGCPTGMVGTFFGLTAPAGWLVCDGTKYNKTDYPSLFAHLSTFSAERRAEWGNADWVDEFNVPNLLGEFPRFSGTNAHTNQGSGAAVAVHQDATEFRFANLKQSAKVINVANIGSDSGYISKADSSRNSVTAGQQISTTSTTTGAVNSMLTSRPTNTSFLPIIKY